MIADEPGTEDAGTDPAARNRALRWAAALVAAVTAACATACAGPPSKGEVHGATLNQSHNNVVILAREPQPEIPPEQLVFNFLTALTGDQKDPTFSVAQEYLTPDARAKWIPAGSTLSTQTKIVDYNTPVVDTDESADHSMRPAATSSPAPAAAAATAAPTVGEVKTVSASGPEYAQIDQYGFFQYLAQQQTVKQTFKVKYLGPATGWRISEAPEFRMVNPESFKRAYQMYQSPLPVYLPAHGTDLPHMDQVYLTQATGKVDYTYDALARAVLHGRYTSQNSNLVLQNPVTVNDSGLATVTLHVPQGGMPNIADVQRALSLTFRDASETPQLLSPTPLNQLQVTYAGCTSSLCKPTQIGQAFAPPPTPTVYWVCPQGQNGTDTAIVSRLLSNQSTAPYACPANGGKALSVVSMNGIRLQKNSPIAVKQSSDSSKVKAPAATTTVAVLNDKGSVIVLNDKNSDQRPWYTASDPSKVTDLEWDPVDGSLWVVDDENLYKVQDPGPDGPSGDSQEAVVVPGGQVTRFKPSPDGQRAVVVSPLITNNPATASSPQPASMVTIDRTGGVPTLSTDTVFQLLAGPIQTGDSQTPALHSVLDAAWADGRTVVLLGTEVGSTTAKLYNVYLDGSQDSTNLEPEDAQPAAVHITAATGGNGHPSLWTVSDAPGPDATTYTYFKHGGGADSFQEIGSNPVGATVTGS